MVRVRLLPYMRSPIHSPSSLTMIWRCFTSSGDVRAIVSLAGSTIRSRWLARCRQAELDVPLNVQTLRVIAIEYKVGLPDGACCCGCTCPGVGAWYIRNPEADWSPLESPGPYSRTCGLACGGTKF